MDEDLLSKRMDNLIHQDARINITKKNVGENEHIDATIEGNPIAAAYAIFQAIKDDNILFHSLRFFMSKR